VINATKPGHGSVTLLYLFGAALALYPPFAQFAQPIIFLSFCGIVSLVIFGFAFQGRALPGTQLYTAVGVLTVVYSTWMFVAVLYGNDLTYSMQDSLGFVLYLLMPIVYVFVKTNNLQHQLCKLILNLCTFIAVVTVGLVAWYYLSFGEVESDSLLALNFLLKSYGLNWVVDHNDGLLGVYTYTAHFFLLGIGLAFYFYGQTRQVRHIALIALFVMGILADGHRALVVALGLLALILLPTLKTIFSLKRMLMVSGGLAVTAIALILWNIEWILGRFNFTDEDPSTLERSLQVPALVDKIMQHPFFGSGFGAFARVIRSPERPFMYEVDFLATMMKLGIVGSLLYFGAYLYMLDAARRRGGALGYVLFGVGLSFLLYMGTNGGLAMSPDAAIFHMFLFILIALSIDRRISFEVKPRTHSVGAGS
jgi:hypothetical protein